MRYHMIYLSRVMLQSSFYFVCSAKNIMVRLPFPDHTRFQKSQTDNNHKEENQNYNYYHQEQYISTGSSSTAKENNQNALVVESQEQHVLSITSCI